MPERLKVATKTRRKGQGRGQKVAPARLQAVAAEHGVSPDWLRLVAEGSLDDPAFVQAIREANTANLWHLVSPAAQEALARATYKFERLGGSRDGVLVFLLDVLSHVSENHNFFATRTPLQFIEEHIDWEVADFGRRERLELQKQINDRTIQAEEEQYRLRLQIEALRPDAERSRRSTIGLIIANQIRAEESESDSIAKKWKDRVDSRDKRKMTAAAMHHLIADEEEDITPDGVKKRIQRLEKRIQRLKDKHA